MDCGQGTAGNCWINARSSRLPSNWSIPHGEHVPFDALCATQPAGSAGLCCAGPCCRHGRQRSEGAREWILAKRVRSSRSACCSRAASNGSIRRYLEGTSAREVGRQRVCSLTVQRDFGKLSVLLSARLFLAAGVPFVGKCNGRGETGGPLLASPPPSIFGFQKSAPL